MATPSPHRFWRSLFAAGFVFATCQYFDAFLLGGIAKAQISNDLLLDDIFLKQSARPEGSRFTIDLPDGTRCTKENGTPPTLSFFGGYSFRNDFENRSDDSLTALTTEESSASARALGGGYAGGAVLSFPLGANTHRNCDASYNLHIAAQKLELAQVLHDQGVLSDEELQELLAIIKDLVTK